MRQQTITMNPTNEIIVRDGFRALDHDKDGFLDAKEFYTLYLGLGFRPERIKEEDLIKEAGLEEKDALISEDQALLVLQKYPRNDSDYLEEVFQMLDTGGKGYIEGADMLKLATEMGGNMSEQKANLMVSFCSEDGRVDFHDFRRLMSPQEN